MTNDPSKIAHRMRNAMQGVSPFMRSARDWCDSNDKVQLENMRLCLDLAEMSVKVLMEQIELLEKFVQNK